MSGLRLAVNFQRIDPSRGGAETYVADLCRRLVRDGHSIDLYAESWDEAALPPEVKRVRVPVEGRTRTARIWSFATNSATLLGQGSSHDCTIGFINTWAHDVLIPQGGVHDASLEHNALRFRSGLARSLYRAGKRLSPRFGLYRAIEARQYDPEHGAKLVVAVSKMVRGHLERFHGVPAERVRIVPNAIDADRLNAASPASIREAFRAAHGLRSNDLVALFVGHNFRLKGLPDLLEALALRTRRAAHARPVHLLVCGGGRLEPIRRQVERLGLTAVVHLAGFIPDVRDAYHASDLFVLPTYYDPCSLVVFEALAVGLPVITTAYNGAGELIEEGREGFVIPSPRAHVLLADALDCLTDDAARRGMAAQAAELGQAQSFDRHMERLTAVFEEVAAMKRRPIYRNHPHRERMQPDAEMRRSRE